MKRFISFVVIAAVTATISVPASANTVERGESIEDFGEETVRILIDDPSLAEYVADSVDGAKVVVDTNMFAAIEVSVGLADEVRDVASNAGVDNVEDDVLMRRVDSSMAVVSPTDPYYGFFSGLQQMNMPSAWDLTRGSSDTVIAIVDTGVATIPELSGRVLPGYSLIAGQPARVPAADGKDDSHGTLSAVVAAGAMNNGVGNVGSCPLCTILPIRVFSQDPDSLAFSSDVAAGVIWAADNGADIISMSFGGTSTNTAVSNAMKYASDKGAVLVGAAGNNGNTTPFYPAAYPEVMSVGGIDNSGNLYSWSNRGSFVDYAAHGCNYGQDDELFVVVFCGTSSATPLLAGALGLYVALNPTHDPIRVRNAAATVRTPVAGISGGYINAMDMLGVSPISGSVNSVSSPGIGRLTVGGSVGVVGSLSPANLRVYLSTGQTLGTFDALGAFSETVNSPGGSLNVCVDASHPTAYGPKQLGCQPIVLPGGNPVGSLDSVAQLGPGAIQVQGWSIDPDVTDPVSTHVYVDGRYFTALTANTSRPDVGSLFPDYGDNHGYFTSLNLPAGNRRVCVYAINVGSGNDNPLLGCRSVFVLAGNPIGSFETGVQFGPGNVRLNGWAFDPDTVDPVAIHVYVNGRWGTAATANTSRPDVGRAYPGYGNNHGFSFDLSMSAGTNNVCVHAINIGAGNANSLLGCRTVVVRSGNPIGSYERVSRVTNSTVRINGWALDFDTVNPVTLHVYVDGRWGGTYLSNTSRLDVGRAFPGYGNNHGFASVVTARPGSNICVYAINVGPGNSNPLLGCRRAP